jgi:hypothetical protein
MKNADIFYKDEAGRWIGGYNWAIPELIRVHEAFPDLGIARRLKNLRNPLFCMYPIPDGKIAICAGITARKKNRFIVEFLGDMDGRILEASIRP